MPMSPGFGMQQQYPPMNPMFFGYPSPQQFGMSPHPAASQFVQQPVMQQAQVQP